MGTADIGERELYQGLIKVAAGFVHAVRGNPPGIARNLEGARDRCSSARAMPASTAVSTSTTSSTPSTTGWPGSPPARPRSSHPC